MKPLFLLHCVSYYWSSCCCLCSTVSWLSVAQGVHLTWVLRSCLRPKVTCSYSDLGDWLSSFCCIRVCVSVCFSFVHVYVCLCVWLSSYTSDCRRKGQQPDMVIMVVFILRTSLRVSESNSSQNNKPSLRQESHCSYLWSSRIPSLS